MMRIAKGRLVDYWRRHQSMRRLVSAQVEQVEEHGQAPRLTSHNPQQAAADSELIGQVKQVIGAMGAKERIVLYLSLIEEKNAAQIARMLDLKPSTVRMRLARGLEKLRSRLRKRGIEAKDLK